MKKLLRLFNIGIFLSLSGVVNAETDLLNLGAYSEGDSPSYGENVVVEQDEKTAVKWITQGPADSAGKLNFPVNLSGEFEVLFEVKDSWMSDIELFLTADEYRIKVDVDAAHLYAGDEYAGGDQSKAITSSKNAWKLSVSNNIVKLYINNVFSQKVTLKPDLTYTQLLVQGMDDDEQVYALNINGSGGSTQPPVSDGGNFEEGKQTGIQQCVSDPASCGISVTATCDGTTPTTSGAHASYNPANGEVHIPFIDVPGPFGDQQVYEVYLIQQPSTFSFDLDLNRLNLRQ
jgi:hypothetical protein